MSADELRVEEAAAAGSCNGSPACARAAIHVVGIAAPSAVANREQAASQQTQAWPSVAVVPGYTTEAAAFAEATPIVGVTQIRLRGRRAPARRPLGTPVRDMFDEGGACETSRSSTACRGGRGLNHGGVTTDRPGPIRRRERSRMRATGRRASPCRRSGSSRGRRCRNASWPQHRRRDAASSILDGGSQRLYSGAPAASPRPGSPRCRPDDDGINTRSEGVAASRNGDPMAAAAARS